MCGRSPLAFLAARRAVSRLEKVLLKQVKRRHRKNDRRLCGIDLCAAILLQTYVFSGDIATIRRTIR